MSDQPIDDSAADSSSESASRASSSAVERLYERYLRLRAREGGASFEAFLDEHPAHADELRSLHGWMERASEAQGLEPTALELGYELYDRIGAGGDGEVWRARDRALDRIVAIKILKLHDEPARSRQQRFLEEARSLARIRHEHVVRIQAVEEQQGEVRLIMELVDGETLRQRVEREGPLSAREAAQVGIALCRALGAMHQAELVHMDVKPANAMRERGGRIVLLDFGLVRSPGEGGRSLGGTPPFMAPEHFGDGEPGPRTDVYGLGATLYWLLSGRYPAPGRDVEEIRPRVLGGELVPLLDVQPGLPAGIVEIVERAMARAPAARYESMGYFERALRAFMNGEEPSTHLLKKADVRGPGRRIALIAAGLVLASFVAAWAPWEESGTGPLAAEGLRVHAQLLRRARAGEPEILAPGDEGRVRLDDELQLRVRGSLPFYLYLFSEDDRGRCFTLYSPAEGSAPLLPDTPLVLPHEAGHWSVDTPADRERLYLIASPKRDPLGEFLVSRIPQAERAGFSLRELDAQTRGALRSITRGIGKQSVPDPDEAGGGLETSLESVIAEHALRHGPESGTRVQVWSLQQVSD